jgi:hypothetical protein
MTDTENLGDRRHRQPAAIGGADRLVAVLAQVLGKALDLGLAGGVVLGEGDELRVGVGSFPSGSADSSNPAPNSC